MSAAAALLAASCSGSWRMGFMMLAVRSMNTMSTPGVMPRPDRASQAPARKVPSCAVTPAAPASVPITVMSRRFSHFARSISPQLPANRPQMAASALKLFMTEKPLRQSFSAATKALLRSETRASARSARPPAASAAPAGSRKKAQDMRVIAGL